jgi:hypothetical protein
VRPWIRRTARIVLPVLLLAGAWQIWGNVEARRNAPLLAKLTAARRPVTPLQQPVAAGWAVQPWESPDNAARFYAAAAMASRRRTWKPGVGEPLSLRRDAMSRGVLPSAEVFEESRQLVAGNEWSMRLAQYAAGLEVQLPQTPIEGDRPVERLVVVDAAIAHQTLNYAQQGDAEAAVDALIVRARMLRMFQPDQWGWGVWMASQVIRGIAGDTALVLAWTAPSDTQLQRLDTALAAMVPRDQLRWTLVEMALYRSDLARRLGLQGAMAPLMASNLHAMLVTMDRAIEATALPWPNRIEAINQLSSTRPLLQRLGPMGLWDLVPPVSQTAMQAAESEAITRAARVALAIERHRRVQDRAPDTLAVLTFADDMTDPFTGGEVRYARSDEGYVVYSLGQNRSDDGGTLTQGLGRTDMPGRARLLDAGVRVGYRRAASISPSNSSLNSPVR